MPAARWVVCMLAALVPLAALSEGQGGVAACRADAARLCRGVEPGGGRIKECLIDHQKEISDACYDALKAMLERRRGPAGEVQPPEAAAAPGSRAVYKVKRPDGRTVYSDAPSASDAGAKELVTGRLIERGR